jgi:Leucine-rich repeat (LRR) protein
LPNQIGNVKGLLVLRAGFNKLRDLPEEFTGLANLQTLSLRDNPALEALPSVASFRSLSKLSLRNTKLSQVPAEVCDLPNLSELDLRDNLQMRDIPVSARLLSPLAS